jgi:hypothetical protein
MARYNTVISSASLAAASTTQLTTPNAGAFTEFTGTTYGVTIGDPALFSGLSQTFYNAASGTVTLTSGGSGTFRGPGSSGGATQALPATSTLTLYSDGTNWITAFDGGGPLVATTGAFNGDLTNGTAAISVFNGSTTVNAFTGATTASIGSLSTSTSTTGFSNGVTASGSTNTVNIASQGASGSTTAINLGNVVSTTTATVNGTLSFAGASSGTVKFIAPSAAGTQSYTWPGAVPGTSGYALTSTTGGVLSWANVSPTITDTTSNATYYPVFNSTTSGQLSTANIASSGLTFNPNTNNLVVAGVVNSLTTENLQSTSYTLALTDRNKVVTMSAGASAATFTVPPNSSVAFPIGSRIWLQHIGTGSVNLAAGAGVTVYNVGNFAQYEVVMIIKRLTDTWTVQQAPSSFTLSPTGAQGNSNGIVTFSSAGSGKDITF